MVSLSPPLRAVARAAGQCSARPAPPGASCAPADSVPDGAPSPSFLSVSEHAVRIGVAGWAVRKEQAALFPGGGSHLERYAGVFDCVEVNSSFYRPHRPATYARWARSVPPGFRFAVKAPRELTHTRRLADPEEPLARFLEEARMLGEALGPVLVQLPPSLAFSAPRADAFLATLRARHQGPVAWEPRHPTWFSAEADALLARHRVARVMADPAVVPGAALPGGDRALVYARLHGSPRTYYSAYAPDVLLGWGRRLAAEARRGAEVWCVLDNTALGAAPLDALALREGLAEQLSSRA